jgi:FtsP/CotA-like multicopper oxidase with cupredoxin domain
MGQGVPCGLAKGRLGSSIGNTAIDRSRDYPMIAFSRRWFFAAAALTALPRRVVAGQAVPDLVIDTRTIEVKGKAATVFGIAGGADGRRGHAMNAGERFRLRLGNKSGEAALIHWHGLTPPNAQDGVPGVTQPLLAAGQSYDYDFPVLLPGTNWMHSHHSLQEQRMMAAPLIVRDPKEAGDDVQEIVVMLHDFSFRDPAEILSGLSQGMTHGGMTHDHAAMDHSQMNHDMSGMDVSGVDMSAMQMGGMDLNDVTYDAFLANDRTLDDPEVVRVEKGQRLRLRIINGAAATNFLVDLGALSGELRHVDGRPIEPVAGSRFPLAMAQRADIFVTLPAEAGAWPILFQREGDSARTGIIAATKDGAVLKIPDRAHHAIGAIDAELPMLYRAAEPLPARTADRKLTVVLTGNMMTYQWGVGDAAKPAANLPVKAGERVEIELINQTQMSHPMHLHGHHFQVVAVNGAPVAGAVRDTELVPVGGRVTIAFDAGNPGRWMFHCHNLYHMLSGMMTEVSYL